jgi:heat shock protein HtpX
MQTSQTGMNPVLKTFILLAGMTGILLIAGWLLGGGAGLIILGAVSIAINFFAYWFSGSAALKMSKARAVDEAEAPELHRMIAELAQRAGVPKPGVYVTPAQQPNAFATGRNHANASIAVTEGIMQAMPRRELEGVLAHEMAHIANRDILIASIAAMIAGVISWLGYAFFFLGDDDSPLGAVGGLLMIFLAPMAATIMQFAISRQREFVADASGARLMGDALPLADALETLQRGADRVPLQVNQAAAPLYIVNPLAALSGRSMSKLFSTHPPTEERVARLRRMAGEPSFEQPTF